VSDLRGNPWTFTTADVATTTAITSIVRNGQGSALVTSTAHGRALDDYISIQATTILGWQKGYRVLAVPTVNTFLVGITPDQYLLANNGANGNVVSLIYRELIEVTQMLWDGPTAADVLLVTDQFGRIVWNPTAVAGGSLTYMKAFPINGLVLNTMAHGILQVSI
jgi:hypothetical protein